MEEAKNLNRDAGSGQNIIDKHADHPGVAEYLDVFKTYEQIIDPLRDISVMVEYIPFDIQNSDRSIL